MKVFWAFLTGFAYCSINPIVLNYLTRMYQRDQPNSTKTASQHFAPILACDDPVYMSKRLCKVLSARTQCLAILRLFYVPQGKVDGILCTFQEESKLRQELAVKFPYLEEFEGSIARFDYNILWKLNQIRFKKLSLMNKLELTKEAERKTSLFKMQWILYYKFFPKLANMEPYAMVLEIIGVRG